MMTGHFDRGFCCNNDKKDAIGPGSPPANTSPMVEQQESHHMHVETTCTNNYEVDNSDESTCASTTTCSSSAATNHDLDDHGDRLISLIQKLSIRAALVMTAKSSSSSPSMLASKSA